MFRFRLEAFIKKLNPGNPTPCTYEFVSDWSLNGYRTYLKNSHCKCWTSSGFISNHQSMERWKQEWEKKKLVENRCVFRPLLWPKAVHFREMSIWILSWSMPANSFIFQLHCELQSISTSNWKDIIFPYRLYLLTLTHAKRTSSFSNLQFQKERVAAFLRSGLWICVMKLSYF